MIDASGRTIDYLRVSVTDRCNLRCVYCMPAQGVEPVPYGELLTLEEIAQVCAAAARLNEGLAEGAEEIHIIPATYQTERSLAFPGTKVLMKAGRQMEKVKELLKGADLTVSMVENCCMEGERVCRSLEEIGETPGYYSLIIAKEAARDEE